MADQNARLGDMAEIKFVFDLQQIVQHPRGQIPHVARAFAKIFVVRRHQRRDVTFRHGVEGGLGVDLLLA